MSTKIKSIGPSVSVYRTAQGLYKSAEYLINSGNSGFDKTTCVRMSCGLAIELYFKACLASEVWEQFSVVGGHVVSRPISSDVSENDKIHSLSDLYSRLPSDCQESLRKEYAKSTLSGAYPKIGSYLKFIGIPFVEFRYPYSDLYPKIIRFEEIFEITKVIDRGVGEYIQNHQET